MTDLKKDVVIYTLDYCPYCMKAKIFLDEHNVEQEEMRKELTEKYSLKSLATFPQIIVNGVNIGGYSDMVEKYNNKQLIF